uniref:EF-hand domain-containing protein n=1 Tax=Anolis carolinensis TaxID=28377 RepID=A0A803T4V0_ANOCA
MDEAEQDQYEAHLKELFDSFDVTGTGTLGQEELRELGHVLHLEEVAPGALQRTLLQDGLPSRVHFDQFKDALILILSSTLTNEESFQPQSCFIQAVPKLRTSGKRGKRKGLRLLGMVGVGVPKTPGGPKFDHASFAVFGEEKDLSLPFSFLGQLRFWNPDDLNASPSISPTQDWIEEKLCEVCESLGISRDGHLSRKKLVSICEQYGLQNIGVLEEVFRDLEHNNGTMSIEDFFYGLFKIRKPLPPSASTPYRQLKRHLSMLDETGRRHHHIISNDEYIGFRVFSSLDDGMGYAAVEQILDVWHEEGIENSHEILKALDFSLDGKINLAELTLALENELLVVKNGIYQAALASFKTEIQHLMERVDQVAREKEKLRLDLEKAEKLTSLMAREVDDHHAAIERQNEYNLSKLDEEYKERVAALKNELQKDREQLQHQASKQRADMEQEVEKLKTEENYLRDRLALTLKENTRLEKELLETGEKVAKYEGMMSKLQKNWENVLAEKFGDLDPGSAEFFLQEERLMQMKNKYEQQCREFQDQIDELQSQLEEYQAQGRIVRPSLQNSLYQELDDGGVECEPASEECNPLNMSIEAEMVIEQMKDQHYRDLHNLQQELENTVSCSHLCLEAHMVLVSVRGCNHTCPAHMVKLLERNNKLEGYLPKLITLQCQLDEVDQEALALKGEKAQRLEEVRKLEEVRDQLGKTEELVANLKALKGGRHSRCESAAKEVEAEKKGLHELNRKLREKVATLLKQNGTQAQEREDLKAALHDLQSTCAQQRQKLEFLRCEAEHLREENTALKNEIGLLNEEGSVSNLRLRELNGSQEELWHKIGTVQKEKAAMQKMAENFKKQASELRARNHQLEVENAKLGRRSSPHQADTQDLNQQLRKVFRPREKEAGKCGPEEGGRERSQLKEELENYKIQSSTLVSSLETELSQLRVQARALEQENNFLKEELEKVKQLPRCPDLSDLQNEISSVIVKNEKLLKEKEALNEELNRCVEKLAKAAFLENLVSSLKQEKTSLEHQNQSLKTQIAASQDKIQSFDDAVQNVNLQMSRLRSDLRLSQQEKEALEQDVMSLHKQLQTASDKNRVLEAAMNSAGLQSQQKKLYWEELDQLVKEEQQLLRQENERLQREVQGAKTDLTHSREKVRQLESTVLSFKHQKHQSQSGIVKAIEQEKLGLKRECERLQKELALANRKISQMNSLERELQTINLENEGLRKKQVRLDEQVMEALFSSWGICCRDIKEEIHGELFPLFPSFQGRDCIPSSCVGLQLPLS